MAKINQDKRFVLKRREISGCFYYVPDIFDNLIYSGKVYDRLKKPLDFIFLSYLSVRKYLDVLKKRDISSGRFPCKGKLKMLLFT